MPKTQRQMLDVPDAAETAALLNDQESTSFMALWCCQNILRDAINVTFMQRLFRDARRAHGHEFAETLGRLVVAAEPKLRMRVSQILAVVLAIKNTEGK